MLKWILTIRWQVLIFSFQERLLKSGMQLIMSWTERCTPVPPVDRVMNMAAQGRAADKVSLFIVFRVQQPGYKLF
jgi:hypothetical protein